MKQILLISLFILLFTTIFGQVQFHMQYGTVYHDEGKKVIQTQDQNYFVVGHTFGFGSAGNALIMKVNINGTILWEKDYPGINFDEINDVLELSDKSIVICGTTESYGLGSKDAFVMKTDSLGNLIWAKTYGSNGWEAFYHIAKDGTNGFYVAGNYPGNGGSGSSSSVVARLDSLGVLLWARKINDWSSCSGNCIGMAALASGGVVLAETVTPGSSFSIYKFSSLGTVIWSYNYDPTTVGGLYDVTITATANDEILVNYGLHTTSLDNFALKLNSVGGVMWCKSYGGLYSDYPKTIHNTHDGGFILFGSTNSIGYGGKDACLIKIQSNGNFQWAKVYGTVWDNQIADGVQTADKGFIFTGQTWSSGYNNDSCKIYLVKTDSLGGNASCNNTSWNVTVNNHSVTKTAALNPVSPSYISTVINWAPFKHDLRTVDLCDPMYVNSYSSIVNKLTIYPNPFRSETTIQTNYLLNNATLTLNNVLGQKVKEIKNIFGYKIYFERENLPNGTYFLHLKQNEQIIVTSKLIIVD